MRVNVTVDFKSELRRRGVESFHNANGGASLPANYICEAPCSLKWMQLDHSGKMGAFSYAVSGYYFATSIGRYTSIGEDVQIGRQDHPLDWLSTSPFQYLNASLFEVGSDFNGGTDFQNYRSHLVGKASGTTLRPVTIGHDVWIGHGAIIRAGVNVGNGAVIAGGSVVVKDVEPYAVVGGNPARLIRFRFPEAKIVRLERLQWWRFAPWQFGEAPFDKIDELIDYLEQLIPTLQPFEPDKFTLSSIE